MDIYVLNKSFQQIGIIDVFESLVWVERYYGFGEFEIFTSVTAELLSILQEEYYLQIPDSDKTMIIESIGIRTNVETGNKLIVKGRSLECLLERRIVWEQTQINQNIQDAIWGLVDAAMINPQGTVWPPYRKVNNMLWTYSNDPLVTTPIVKGQYLQNDLYEVVTGLCKEVSVGIKIILDASNYFEVSVYAGKDRSYAQSTNPYVVFSPTFENLLNSDYLHSIRYFKTLSLILGHITDDGQFFRATKGITVPNWTTFTGIYHRELGVDATHIPRYLVGTSTQISDSVFTDQIREYGFQKLLENGIVSQFDGQADTTNSYKYRTDFFLGDIIQVENEYGLTGRSRITEVTISENLSGRAIYPTFEKII